MVGGIAAATVVAGVIVLANGTSKKVADTPEKTTDATLHASSSPTASVEANTPKAPSVSASASAPASAAAENAESNPPKDPKSLAPDLGYVFVKFDGEGDVVLLGGKRVGKVNTWLEVGCKLPMFASIATPGNPPKGGRSVRVNCQDKQVLTFTAADLAVPAGGPP